MRENAAEPRRLRAAATILVLPFFLPAASEGQTEDDRRYFDFWPGTWVEVVDGRPDTSATTFTVRESVHASAFEEDWKLVYEGEVHRSVGLRAWDPGEERWMFTWADDAGRFQIWQGRKFGEQWFIVREFEVGGDRFLSRQAWVPVGDDELMRVMERSFDGGATWEPRSRTRFVRVAGPDRAEPGGVDDGGSLTASQS